MSSSGAIFIESQPGDLKLKISIKYQQRSGKFRRQASKRSEAVFGKSIEKFFLIPTGLYVFFCFLIKINLIAIFFFLFSMIVSMVFHVSLLNVLKWLNAMV